MKLFKILLVCLALTVPTFWAIGAIHFDGPFPGLGNTLLLIGWIFLLISALVRFRTNRDRMISWLGLFFVVLIPWLLKKPPVHNDWSPEFARVPTAIINGDAVTFQNFRNFDYRPDSTAIERWETRTVHLSNLRHMDFFVTYFGSDLIAHPIFSFDFGPEGHIAFSIESRRKPGEVYSPIGGLYKRYGLLYIVSNESDVIRLRTNFREDEEVYLYRLQVNPETPRARFMEYVNSIQNLSQHPRFYNSITDNCTTAVRAQMTNADRHTLDWRILFNGKLDELLHEKNLLLKSPPFPELKKQSHINPAAHTDPNPETFSETIREGRPGF